MKNNEKIIFIVFFFFFGGDQAKKNICVFTVTCQKNLGSVGIKFFYYYYYRQNPEIVVSGISFSKFPVK